MDWEIMMRVLMSMLFFAPLLIVLIGALFVGVLVTIEGFVSLVSKKEIVVVQDSSGPIVQGLKDSISQEKNVLRKV